MTPKYYHKQCRYFKMLPNQTNLHFFLRGYFLTGQKVAMYLKLIRIYWNLIVASYQLLLIKKYKLLLNKKLHLINLTSQQRLPIFLLIRKSYTLNLKLQKNVKSNQPSNFQVKGLLLQKLNLLSATLVELKVILKGIVHKILLCLRQEKIKSCKILTSKLILPLTKKLFTKTYAINMGQ